jgi:copper chaperone NosL
MTMTKLSRLLVAAAALLLLTLFGLPLWRIYLLAPQYPEGLGLEIHLNTVHGASPNDLGNINELNHYIGMKTIDPDAIPALHIMPWVVVALALTGLIVALVGRRKLLIAWLVSFVGLSLAGFAEFWRWEYDYGHNLDFEHAIIKVPGMTYQPPIIGSKQLLNFTAVSWPGPGAWVAALAVALAVTALVMSRRRQLAGRPSVAPADVPVGAAVEPAADVRARRPAEVSA